MDSLSNLAQKAWPFTSPIGAKERFYAEPGIPGQVDHRIASIAGTIIIGLGVLFLLSGALHVTAQLLAPICAGLLVVALVVSLPATTFIVPHFRFYNPFYSTRPTARWGFNSWLPNDVMRSAPTYGRSHSGWFATGNSDGANRRQRPGTNY